MKRPATSHAAATRSRTSKLANWPFVGVACVLLFALPHVHGEDLPKTSPVPDDICAKLQILFQRYYPKATFTNLRVNGFHIEYDVATFEFPYTGPPHAKHEATTQRGPKKDGILCSVYLQKGEYMGPLAFSPRGGGQYEPVIIDRKAYKQLFMVPYSAKRDAHLVVNLSYPSDTNDALLKEFRALMKDFTKEVH